VEDRDALEFVVRRGAGIRERLAQAILGLERPAHGRIDRPGDLPEPLLRDDVERGSVDGRQLSSFSAARRGPSPSWLTRVRAMIPHNSTWISCCSTSANCDDRLRIAEITSAFGPLSGAQR
jgi:hypothetical protein